MRRALLDTNIVINREAHSNRASQSIGTLFKWLEKAAYEKCIHPITIDELTKNSNQNSLNDLNRKLDNYSVLKTIAPLTEEVQQVSNEIDHNDNDLNDTKLLNEVFQDRVDILISEDKKIHTKALRLNIQERVYNIDSFLEKVVSENPQLINYDVLSATKKYFGNIDLKDTFFDSFRLDYQGFDEWFNKKADEIAYVTHNKGRLLSFLYVKVEEETENYSDISPVFQPKKRLKIGTFKIVSNGVRLGERFLKIIFDNAIQYKVDEIYVTIFNKTDEQNRLINLLKDWGFAEHGKKGQNELVLVRDFAPSISLERPKVTYPYISANQSIFLCSIYPEYHTELFPDSILTTESTFDFKENQPHRNALSKVYISRSINRNLKSGDVIVFYRTGGRHKGVVTTIGIVESVNTTIQSERDFILKTRKRSVFSDEELKKHWNYRGQWSRPFIVNFLYAYSLPKRPNLSKLIELGIIADVNSAPRGFEKISQQHFSKIIKESQSDESIVVN